jgi:site-specific DNA-methyltransferase (cytosine-N4-specific)
MALATVEEVRHAFSATSWDFAEAHSRRPIHDVHPYPARFIPDIPARVIDLVRPELGVLDPFCGSGTALVEAGFAGFPSVGIDLNPLACLVASVKTGGRPRDLLHSGRAVLDEARGLRAAVPPIPRLGHWFTETVAQGLANIVDTVARVESEQTRRALQVALSRIIVRVSNQESDTRYASVSKGLNQDDVYRLFDASVRRVDAALADAFGDSTTGFASDIVTTDVFDIDVARVRQVDLVVTSPPYPNAFEYWLYHKYRMYWLGMDPISVREREIGARPHYFRKNPATEDDFATQMKEVFRLLSAVMSPNGYAVFVIGDSVIRGRRVDNKRILTTAAAAADFHVVAEASRRLNPHRKSFNLSHARIKTESVVCFRRSP